MSRPHIMPLLAPEAPGRGLGQRAARATAIISGRLRARAAARQARVQLTCLAVTTTLDGGPGSRLADAIVRRVLHCGCPVGTVVLDLGPVTSLDDEACAAILSVHQRLTAIGTRLRLAASGHGLADRLAGAGITQQLGRDAIHPSFRSAVLATYAALPGPGLVLGRIKTALETEAEFISLLLLLSSPPMGGAASPAWRWTVSATSIRRGKDIMADLIAIGYPDEGTAEMAADEARRLAQDLIIEPDAIAVIVRDKEGKFHVHTSHHPVGTGATWGMFWGLLFGLLFFIPFFGLAIGAGMGALMGKITKSGIDREFQEQVRGLLKPGTSCLFLMVEKVTPDKATEALSRFGGTVLKSSLSKEGEQQLQEALHGQQSS